MLRTILRITIGVLFIGHGTQKLFGWFGGNGLDATADGFEHLGPHPSRENAIAGGTAEALGGASASRTTTSTTSRPRRFFATLTGVEVQPAKHFSFPAGPSTFTDLRTFIIAQQHLEGVFDTAFLAAVRELAAQGRSRDAQIMAQIACNEAEHRVLARQIAADQGIAELPNINPGGSGTVPTSPPDNWGYTPVFFHSTPQVVNLVKADGFMSPRPGNDFTYAPINFRGEVYGDVFERITFRTPFAA